MRVYSCLTGKPHDAEPVDCRELLQSGMYTTEQPSEEAIAGDLSAAGKEAAAGDGEVGANGDPAVVVAKPAGGKKAGKKAGK